MKTRWALGVAGLLASISSISCGEDIDEFFDEQPRSLTCGPSTCAGCCFAGSCVTEVSASQCGRAGSACLACSEGERCTSGACEFDLDMQWLVVVHSANIDERNGAGENWDSFGGAPDPMVCVTAGATRTCSATVQDTISPVWAQVVAQVSARVLSNGIFVEFYDEDVANDDLICEGNIPVDVAHIRGGELDLTCGATTRLYLRFQLP